MSLEEVSRFIFSLLLAFFLAMAAMTSGDKAAAQSATITINNYCSETIYVGAWPATSITSVSIGGAGVTTPGGWEMAQNTTATVTVPDNFSGRFWGRTGCSFNASNGCDQQTVTVNDNNYVIANCCDTGGCLDSGGNFALNCAQTGLPPSTLAEFTLASGGLDAYDVSMVDGGNMPVSIIPNSSDYDCSTNGNCTFTGNLPGKNSSACSQDSDCYPLFGNGYKWKCNIPTGQQTGLCVNPFFCGSPGCTATGGCAPNGLNQSLLPGSSWGGGNFAVSESSCPSDLQLMNDQNQGSTYVGCLAPQKYCRQSCSQDGDCGPPYTFNCGASGYCEYQDGTVIGADCDASVSNTTYGQLWGCTGVNAASCFTAGAGNDCCGCPSWAPGFSGTSNGACIGGNNTTWQQNAEPSQGIFNTASPTAYAFPYDDSIKLFNCQTATSGQPVNYTVNFCPNDSDGDGVQNSADADSDNDGVPDSGESGFQQTSANVSARLTPSSDDPDGDGIPNHLDLDSDNDGLPDHYECGGTNDADKDGVVDSFADSNGDGLDDGAALTCGDTDGDGLPDFVDTDSDNDGTSDFVEQGGADSDGDGKPDSTADSDGDGLLDIFAPDTGDPLDIADSDGDGAPDHLDAEDNGDSVVPPGPGCGLAPAGAAGASAMQMLLFMSVPALIFVRRRFRTRTSTADRNKP